jgi:hypothetical protein
MRPQNVIGVAPRRVLVVIADEHAREELGRDLEAGGDEVLACPGPQVPDYTCVGTRRGTCPLADGTDAVVLDTRVCGDDAFEGATGWQLGTLYRDMGLPVVAIVDGSAATTQLRAHGAVTIRNGSSTLAVHDALARAVGDQLRAD